MTVQKKVNRYADEEKQPTESGKGRQVPKVCIKAHGATRFQARADKSSRAISTARLNMLPCVHLQPINVVVYDDPQGKSNLVVGFALRCFQRLSRPDADTQPCPWQDNWYTGGRSITVLSY